MSSYHFNRAVGFILSFGISLLLLPNVSQAGNSACYVYVPDRCMRSDVPLNSWFTDNGYGTASSNPTVCLRRASEYQQVCGSEKALAYFSAGTKRAVDDSWALLNQL